MIRHVTVFLRNFARADRHGDEIEHSTAVREDCADRHETTAELCIFYHNRVIIMMPRIYPIAFDVFDAHADISLVKNQRDVLYQNHQAVAQRTSELQGVVHVFDFEHDVKNARRGRRSDRCILRSSVCAHICLSQRRIRVTLARSQLISVFNEFPGCSAYSSHDRTQSRPDLTSEQMMICTLLKHRGSSSTERIERSREWIVTSSACALNF